MEKVIIIGSGGLARQIIECFELNNISIHGLIDDFTDKPLYNYKILGKTDDIDKHMDNDINLFCGVGDTKFREKIYNLYKDKYNFINCIHPNSNISKYSSIGKGNYIGPNVSIMPDAIIGANNILDPGTVISHHSIIGNNNHMAANSIILGRVYVGNTNLLGSNCTILPDKKIGDHNIIGAGAVLTRNITDDMIMIGVPAYNKLK